MPSRRLRHGYTNESWLDEGGHIVKRYLGDDSEHRMATEVEALRLAGDAGLPAPPVLAADRSQRVARFGLVEGVHGQELLSAGHANAVLAACGRTLNLINQRLPGLVHGDFGPQNLLFTADAEDVVAVLDWEFAHQGTPIEDIAWCEWIVRMHNRVAVPHLTAFFEAFGTRPTWQARHEEMLRRCASFEELCRRWDDHQGADLWSRRLDATLAWVE